jgi:hypothetical protein
MSVRADQTTEELIAALSAKTVPVRRLEAPWLRFLMWFVVASLVAGSTILNHGLRDDISDKFMSFRFQIEFWSSVLTGILAALSAFMLALPDRSDRWLLVPMPALALWGLTLSGGCYADWIAMGPDGLALGTSFECFGYILETGGLMAVPLIFMLRHAGRIRPGPVAFLAGLSVASLASATLTFFHDLDTSLMVLIWHGGATAVACLICFVIKGPVFSLTERLAR